MYVIIVGAGPVAETLASRVTNEGHQLALITESVETAEKMADRFPRALVIRGAGTDEATLRHARAQECDVFYAVDDDDSRTMVSCLLARDRFNVGRVVALSSRCEDGPAFTALSIDNVCAPEVLVDALMAV